MSYIDRPRDWWVYKCEKGFQRIGGCSEDTAQNIAAQRMPEYDLLLQAWQLKVMNTQLDNALDYQRDVEEEHYNSMMHDVITDNSNHDLEDDVDGG